MVSPERVAIVHEWFTSMRGGEKCVEALCEVFPNATLFVLLHNPGSVSPIIERMPIRTSFIQHLPYAAQRYRHYLPLFPAAITRFDLSEFDLVISSNHCVAKGVRVRPGALHICYCHTPMRYIWDHYGEYFGKDRAGFFTRAGMRMAAGYLRRWDVRTASQPHFFVANSENVRRRIQTIYRRDADVIYPPVDTSLFQLSSAMGEYFLIVSAFVPYKRIDLAIEACKHTGDRLVVVGDGPDATRLRKLSGPKTEFVGWVSDFRLKELYAGCRAVLFPGEEDFGIVPVEAMASGKPVIAFARGGALETVVDLPPGQTGVFFHEQTKEAVVMAIERCKATQFDQAVLRSHAMRFNRVTYQKNMLEYIQTKWLEFKTQSPQPQA